MESVGGGLFSGSAHSEAVPRFCLLKDDAFCWLAKKADKLPKGLLCVSDPGVSVSVPEEGELPPPQSEDCLLYTSPSPRD